KMSRTFIIVSLAILCAACDTFYPISVSRRTSGPLEQSCVLDALRADKTVRSARVEENNIVVELNMPPNTLGGTEHPILDVYLREASKDVFEMSVRGAWVNHKPSDAYRRCLEELLGELSDRVIQRCERR